MTNRNPALGALNKWLSKPAKWYCFWLPQSGPIGGFIAAVTFLVFIDWVWG